ncbi:hypothetical protein BJY01DRAFT_253117 [Aspergillus pseudoustus]|uniref:NAD(P)-binding protein n=1 Tax=Aspergillus pseudoustus TaxID=1810923 RepID=A0ABR4J2A9_9EURO
MEFKIDPDRLHDIEGKTIIVTGGSSGIGSATVRLCLELKVNVVAGDITAPAEELLRCTNLLYLNIDFGRIDHVFANDGIGPRSKFIEKEFEDDGRLAPAKFTTININLLGVINTVRLAAHYLAERVNKDCWFASPSPPAGSVVITASASSFKTFPPPTTPLRNMASLIYYEDSPMIWSMWYDLMPFLRRGQTREWWLVTWATCLEVSV